MILIVDSGSTKCDWLALDSNGKQLFEKQRTKGMNPAILSAKNLKKTISKNDILKSNKKDVKNVYFYGAGCGTEKPKTMLHDVLQDYFVNAEISVNEDTYAAVYATVGKEHKPAVVCILGTGSNCSYFDGEILHQRVDSLGYSIMDDAAGNYFGRQLIRDYFFKKMPETLRVAMASKYNLEPDFIKYNLYKQPNPNAYLASFAEFIFLNKDNDYMTNLIKNGVRLFARNMILQFQDVLENVPVHFAGSIAYFSQNEILEIGNELGFKVGVFERRPIEGLVKYHIDNLSSLNE
jgi:N-acetylglucosamine kinase-like BadF-type ATPase